MGGEGGEDGVGLVGRVHDVAQTVEVIDDVEIVEPARFDFLGARDEFRPGRALAENDAEPKFLFRGCHFPSAAFATGCPVKCWTNQRMIATSERMRFAFLRSRGPRRGTARTRRGCRAPRGFDDLLGFDDRHVGVVGAVEDDRRGGDAIDLVDRREVGAAARASVSGSPYSIVEIAAIQGSVCLKKVSKLTTPKRFAPAAKQVRVVGQAGHRPCSRRRSRP